MAKCKVCEYCGAHLDHGERCDCRDCEDPKRAAAHHAGGVTAGEAKECKPH